MLTKSKMFPGQHYNCFENTSRKWDYLYLMRFLSIIEENMLNFTKTCFLRNTRQRAHA